MIREAWNYHPPNGSPMFKFFLKIKRCRMKLVAWSREVFGNTRIQLKDKQAALKALSTTGYKTNLAQINNLRDEINTLLHQEEVLWRQRSRAIWLPTGDKNTKSFHKRASQRQKKNQIDEQMDRNGIWRTDKQSIRLIIGVF